MASKSSSKGDSERIRVWNGRGKMPKITLIENFYGLS